MSDRRLRRERNDAARWRRAVRRGEPADGHRQGAARGRWGPDGRAGRRASWRRQGAPRSCSSAATRSALAATRPAVRARPLSRRRPVGGLITALARQRTRNGPWSSLPATFPSSTVDSRAARGRLPKPLVDDVVGSPTPAGWSRCSRLATGGRCRASRRSSPSARPRFTTSSRHSTSVARPGRSGRRLRNVNRPPMSSSFLSPMDTATAQTTQTFLVHGTSLAPWPSGRSTIDEFADRVAEGARDRSTSASPTSTRRSRARRRARSRSAPSPTHLERFAADGPTYVDLPGPGAAACGPARSASSHGIRRRQRRRRALARGSPSGRDDDHGGQPDVTLAGSTTTRTSPNSSTDLVSEPRYAIDTEFHRERTYFPSWRSCSWRGRRRASPSSIPLAVDPTPLDRAVPSPTPSPSLHAAQQDLDVLDPRRRCRPAPASTTPRWRRASSATPRLRSWSLVQGELGVTPAKGDRLTDWLRRPLTETQKEYAAADVALPARAAGPPRRQARRARAVGLGAEACEELRARPTGATTPEDAWTRLKDARTLRPRSRAVAQAVAAWREREARRSTCPVRQVLPDLAMLGISQRQPTTIEELRQCRGVDDRHRRGRVGRELLEAVRRARTADPPPPVPDVGDELERSLRPAVTLISAWVSQVAKDARIDTAMLATRSRPGALCGDDPRPAASRDGGPSCSATASPDSWTARPVSRSTARAACG